MKSAETSIQIALANYIVTEYPDVQFHSDYGSGTKLSFKQSSEQKAVNGGRSGWPDMLIAQPIGRFNGLFVELKKDGERIYKRDLSPASEHLAVQIDVLRKLSRCGYCVALAVGFDEAKRVIDSYLTEDSYVEERMEEMLLCDIE